MFHKYQRVFVANTTVIAKQVGQCGVIKLFDVRPNTQYDISLIDYRRGNKNYRENAIVILNVAMQIIGRIEIIRQRNLFQNIDNQKIYIGILFKNAKLNDYFYIKDIVITTTMTSNPVVEPVRIMKTDEDEPTQPIQELVVKQIQEPAIREMHAAAIEPDVNKSQQQQQPHQQVIIEPDSHQQSTIEPDVAKPILRDIVPITTLSYDLEENDDDKLEIIAIEMHDDVYVESGDVIVKNIDHELIEKVLNEPSIETEITEDHHFTKEADVSAPDHNHPEEKHDDQQEKKPQEYGFVYPKYETVAIAIPCHSKHFRYLTPLLESIEKQTLVPNEVIVVLCDSVNVSQKNINDMRNRKWKFRFELVEIRNRSPAGANRYIGCKKATSEIVIFTDADDLIHPQRTEIIKYFFDITDAVHVGHSFTFDTNFDKVVYDIPKIKHKTPIFAINDRIPGMTDGAVAVLRSVVDRVPWDKTIYKNEDVAFNKSIFRTFRKTCMIYAPIYLYRTALSTWQGENEFNKGRQQFSRRF